MAKTLAGDRPGSGFRLASIMGIEIRLDPSVLIIFAIIVFSLAAGLFPDWHPEWSATTAWSTAFAAGVLFFASLLAHELAHSFVARRFGIRVPRITLFLFGGMAEIDSEARTPGHEFAIAIAGPLMSLALALLFSVLAANVLSEQALQSIVDDPSIGVAQANPVASACLWLSSVNFMLAVFNLVPGFPLDGGRVFRALIWRVTGDRLLATRYASTGGRWFGWLIMGLGVWNLLIAKSPGGLWLILIGWFLSHLASAAYSQTLTERLLEPFTVADVMRTRFDRVPGMMPLESFVDDCLLRSSQLLWPVMHGDQTVGTVCVDDVIALDRAARGGMTVADVTRALDDCPTLDFDDNAVTASSVILGAGDRPLPVLKDGDIVGLVRGSDILKWMMLYGDKTRAGH